MVLAKLCAVFEVSFSIPLTHEYHRTQTNRFSFAPKLGQYEKILPGIMIGADVVELVDDVDVEEVGYVVEVEEVDEVEEVVLVGV